MISHDLQCIFVHIPKTGGTSVEKSLGIFTDLNAHTQDHRSIQKIKPEGSPGNVIQRLLVQDPVVEGEVTPGQFQRYYKFTFVRNPFTRAVSWYRNILSDPRHQEKHGVSPDCSFPEFMVKHQDNWALRPQTHWILDKDGQPPFDFIGRFEQFQTDFDKVCDRLGLEKRTLAQERKRPGDKVSYRAFYDEATIELVSERYREEIAMFGYSFDDLD